MKKQDLIIIIALFGLMLAWPMVYTRFFKPAPAPARISARAAENQGATLPDQTTPPAAPGKPAGADQAFTATASQSSNQPEQAEQQSNLPEQILALSNADTILKFSSKGGGLVSAELPGYRQSVEKTSGPLIMDFSNAPAIVYTGLPEFSQADDFNVQRLEGENRLRIEKTTGSGLHFTRLISFGADYQVVVEDTFQNTGAEPMVLPDRSIRLGYMRIGDNETKTYGVDALGVDTLNSSGGESVKYWAGKLPKLFKEQADEYKRVPRVITVRTNTPADWVAVKNKFFVQILAPEGGAAGYQVTAERALEKGEEHDPDLAPKSTKQIQAVSAAALLNERTIAPGESATQVFHLYTGPKNYSILRKLGLHQEDVMDFGMWSLVCKFLLKVLNAIHGVIPNYGVAIILMTILIRILFWPLTHKSTESMKRMQELQPLIAELRKKHKDSPRKLQEETMALYKRHKVNPVSGCLPMLIQIPVFIALFVVLRSAIELRFADFLWIKDLSEPERLLAGVLPIPLNILPILMAAAQAWQQSMTPATDQAQQKMLLFFMPVMMLVMFYMMPSALVLYWLTNTVIMIAQQLIQKKRAALKKMQK